MFSPQRNIFGTTIWSPVDGTRAAAAMGVAVTPAQNAYGSYATLISGANMTVDCCELLINVNTVGVSGVARDCVVSLALDQAGGTSFAGNGFVDLVCGPATWYASNAAIAGGATFLFNIFIRAGVSLGIAASVNAATLTAINAMARVRGRPSAEHLINVGSYIDQFGVTLASSSGTTLTPGGVSEGAYVQVGSALTRPIWQWDFGYGINDSTMAAISIEVDVAVGDATNKKIVITNGQIHTSTIENLVKPLSSSYGTGSIGDLVYGRAQSSNTPDSANSIAVYGVGG